MEPIPLLTEEQERMLFGLMVDTFDIPEDRAKLYLLRVREQALERRGDDLLTQAQDLDPKMAERVLSAFLNEVRHLDQQIKEAESGG